MFKFTLLALFSFCLTAGFSQNTIAGIVRDAHTKKPLAGALVYVESPTEGVVTDAKGQFSLLLNSDERWLKISCPGFETLNYEIAPGETFLNIELKHPLVELDTVIVFDPETYEEAIQVVTVSAYRVPLNPEERKVSPPDPPKGIMEERKISPPDPPKGIMEERKISPPDPPKGIMEEYSAAARKITTEKAVSYAAGKLTAGEVNDFSKWVLWSDKSQEELRAHRQTWKISPSIRFSVMIQNQEGIPMVGEPVILIDENQDTVWQAVTDNTGKAELWAGMFGEQFENERSYSIATSVGKKDRGVKKAQAFQQGVNHISLKKDCSTSNIVDAVFMVDATGSMSDEINYLKEELNDVIEKVKEKNPDLALNLGSVFYRDHGDVYVTKKSPLSGDISQTIGFIKEQYAKDGGDFPEAVDEALLVAINEMNWSDNARAKILFLVLDAPPHSAPENIERLRVAAYAAAKKGIKIIPVTASGIDKSTEYLMRSLALCTNGTYVFLTNHSGIGNAHIEPTTDSYEVEKLNDLLVRLFEQNTAVVDCNKKIPLIAEEIADTTQIQGVIQPETATLPVEPLEENTPESGKFSCRFFPNPTSGRLNVEIEGAINELFLSDLSGKILQRFVIGEEHKFQINISQYPSGVYSMTYWGTNDRPLSGRIVLIK